MCYKCLFGQVPSGNATCKHTRQDTWVTCTDFNRVGLPDASQILPWKPILSFGWGSRRTEHQFKCVGCIGITVPSPLSRFQTNTWKISKKEATLMHLLTTWSGLEAGFFQPWWTLQELTKTHKQKTITSAMFFVSPSPPHSTVQKNIWTNDRVSNSCCVWNEGHNARPSVLSICLWPNSNFRRDTILKFLFSLQQEFRRPYAVMQAIDSRFSSLLMSNITIISSSSQSYTYILYRPTKSLLRVTE